MPLDYESKEAGGRSRLVPYLIVGALVVAMVLFLGLSTVTTPSKTVTVPTIPPSQRARVNQQATAPAP